MRLLSSNFISICIINCPSRKRPRLYQCFTHKDKQSRVGNQAIPASRGSNGLAHSKRRGCRDSILGTHKFSTNGVGCENQPAFLEDEGSPNIPKIAKTQSTFISQQTQSLPSNPSPQSFSSKCPVQMWSQGCEWVWMIKHA